MGRLLTAAMASNTHKTYAVGWNIFCRFQQQQNQAAFYPANAEDIRRFIAWLSLQNYAPATISTYVLAVGYYHNILGCDNPTQDFLVCKLLEGCRRSNPSMDRREPISHTVLQKIVLALPSVCSSRFEATMFKAVFLMAFFGFMRVGEFAATSRTHIQTSILLDTDVCICRTEGLASSIRVTFRFSKNNQHGSRKWFTEPKQENHCSAQSRPWQNF